MRAARFGVQVSRSAQSLSLQPFPLQRRRRTSPRTPTGSVRTFQGDADDDGRLSYFEAHPEWYPLVNGRRVPGIRDERFGTNFCTSNPHATAEFVKNFVQALVDGPLSHADIVRFWTLDAGKWCECEACQAQGTPTDRYLLLVHRFCREIDKARGRRAAPSPAAGHLPDLRRRGGAAHASAARGLSARLLHGHLLPHPPLLRASPGRSRLRAQRQVLPATGGLDAGSRSPLPRATGDRRILQRLASSSACRSASCTPWPTTFPTTTRPAPGTFDYMHVTTSRLGQQGPDQLPDGPATLGRADRLRGIVERLLRSPLRPGGRHHAAILRVARTDVLQRRPVEVRPGHGGWTAAPRTCSPTPICSTTAGRACNAKGRHCWR